MHVQGQMMAQPAQAVAAPVMAQAAPSAPMMAQPAPMYAQPAPGYAQPAPMYATQLPVPGFGADDQDKAKNSWIALGIGTTMWLFSVVCSPCTGGCGLLCCLGVFAAWCYPVAIFYCQIPAMQRVAYPKTKTPAMVVLGLLACNCLCIIIFIILVFGAGVTVLNFNSDNHPNHPFAAPHRGFQHSVHTMNFMASDEAGTFLTNFLVSSTKKASDMMKI